MFRTLEVSDPALAPPGLRFVTVKSAALGHRADMLLFVPPQAAGLRDVPLVVLLHGVYGSHWSWAFQGGAHVTAQRLIDEGAVPPLVLAMPSDGLWGDGSGYVAHAGQDFERWIVDEVPAAARAACTTCSEASPQCIVGLSMGGYGALRLAGNGQSGAAARRGAIGGPRGCRRQPSLCRVGAAPPGVPSSVRAAASIDTSRVMAKQEAGCWSDIALRRNSVFRAAGIPERFGVADSLVNRR